MDSLPADQCTAEIITPACVLPDTVANDTGPFMLNEVDMPALHEGALEAALGPRATSAPHEALQRTFDVALALVFIGFLLPLMAVCALAVRLSGPGPLLFRQVRIGRDGREFLCFKFRTMTPLAEQNLDDLLVASVASREQWELLHKLSQDPRTTPIGRFLRRYSLDELPQLLNVLRGEMSIVGPRPIVDAEIPKYGASFAHYCSVKPGLTGLWQVSGRHALSYDERVMLDARYAISKSLRGDLRILLRTVPVIVLGQNE